MENKSSILTILVMIGLVGGLGYLLYQQYSGNLNGTEGKDGEDGSDFTDNYIYYCSSGDDLQDAIESIGPGLGTIYITQDITLDSTIEIKGSGSYIIEGSNYVIECSSDHEIFLITKARACSLKNLVLDGSKITTNNRNMMKIDEENDNTVQLENIRFTGNGVARGLLVESNNVEVDDCFFSELEMGVYVNVTHNSYLRYNQFQHIDSQCIYIRNSELCTIEGNSFNNTFHGMYVTGCTYISISNNELYYTSYVGIFLHNSEICTLTGNIIAYNKTGIMLSIYGMRIDTSNYNSITGNQISYFHTGGTGFAYGMRLDTSDYNTVVGNTLIGNEIGPISEVACSGNVIANNAQL